ncbi:uncharacterized protein LOC117042136 [Lacerta agilis]|uniref:uncharacterized protein LOC117042136 n=1 Tax=Lacerta agilis TaxID=80427 RepID=UPI001419E120|nr:uncharacterized protein LOC117042136 [Lacerta agilis]
MTGNGSAGTGNGRKGRGVSWRLQETLNLLDIWGEQKIQDQLRNSHQNIDFFEYIAQKMAARGHRRTALECRSKTKVMRLEYKRVIDHNSKAGSSKVTCPFYEQLHRILQGNASMKPSRVGRTLSFHLVPQPEAVQEQPQPPAEEIIPPDVHVVNVGEYLKQEDSDDTGMVTGNGTEEDMAEAGENDVAAMKEEDSNEGSGRDLDYQRPQVNQISPLHQDAPVNTEPPVAHPPPARSPLADFAILRPKKRKGAETLFQELLQQSREEQEELLLEMGRDREVALSLLKTLRQDAAGCREERRQIMETMRAHNEVLKGLAANLNSLTDAFVSHPQARTPRPSVPNSATAQRGHARPNDENCSPRSPLRRLHSNNLSSLLFPANNAHHMA